MPNYFYVKSGTGTATVATATATTNPTVKRTGTWSATAGDHFASIVLALAGDDTLAPVAGDIIICSDAHSHDNISSAIAYSFPATGVPVAVISVTDGDVDVYGAGAKEDTNSSVRFDGKSYHKGVTFETSSSVSLAISNTSVVLDDCTINLMSTNDYFGAYQDGTYMKLINCTVFCASTTNGVRVQGGGTVEMLGGQLTATTTIVDLLAARGQGGGGKIIMHGVDLSLVTGYLLATHGAAQTSDDNVYMELIGCKLNASPPAPIEHVLSNLGTSILMANSSAVSADAEYQYHYQDYFGTAEDSDNGGVHRTDGTAFSDGDYLSMKVTTNVTVNQYSPFAFKLPSTFAALSVAATDTIRVYIATAEALTDTNCWVDAIYPDGTNKQTWNLVSTRNANLLAAGTALTTDSGSTWMNGVSAYANNEYYIDIDTSGDAGADGVPELIMNVGIASVTDFYVDTSYTLS
tara:strand:+ start:1029 stop:2417 length:1389 start_codon:yes stop_codon:yes gene_type:complete